MTELLQLLKQANWLEITGLSLVINVGIYIGSLGLYSLISRLESAKPLGNQHAITQADILLSFVTIICNAIVFILGVYLWKSGIIRLSESDPWYKVVMEVALLTVLMDMLMYIFHRFVHELRMLNKLHSRHHTHVSTNLLSLFVLHPVESIGFGLMMLAVVAIVPFTAIGISIYLLINSVWGTIGHLNVTVLPDSWLKRLKKAQICTAEFHYLHHLHPEFNFGFYFSVWDRLLKTIHPAMSGRN